MSQYVVSVKVMPDGKKKRCRERVNNQSKGPPKETRKT